MGRLYYKLFEFWSKFPGRFSRTWNETEGNCHTFMRYVFFNIINTQINARENQRVNQECKVVRYRQYWAQDTDRRQTNRQLKRWTRTPHKMLIVWFVIKKKPSCYSQLNPLKKKMNYVVVHILYVSLPNKVWETYCFCSVSYYY